MRPGKISDSVLKRSVLKKIKTRRSEVLNGAGVGEDCAIFAPLDACMVTCVQEASVPAGADMSRLIIKCANNLAASGAEPIAVLLAINLMPEAPEELLKGLMEAAEETCGELHIQIAGGHTAVSPYVTQPLVTVTAYGRAEADRALPTWNVGPGQDIVVTKWIGLEGTAILARRMRQELSERYPEFLVEEAAGLDRYLSILPEAALATKSSVCAMHDVSEGGIFGALWELAESAGVGLIIDLKKLPIRQETVEVCEFCGVNPYTLLSGGSLLIAAEDGSALAAELGAAHIPAAVVGRTTDSHDRLILNGEEKRYLDKPQADEIYRFMGQQGHPAAALASDLV